MHCSDVYGGAAASVDRILVGRNEPRCGGRIRAAEPTVSTKLLDRSSLFGLNREGVNVLLVRFEGWLIDECNTGCEILERCAKD